ncbi:MAG: phage virion morphogenesis protein, partial [Candidatus Pacearchaeota archaeon]|nr:phage virion morphogenesis protein [Candidatus Pacearchaeota archaeon]
MDDLTALENWLGPLIQSLARSEKNKLFKRLGQAIRKRQADRIRKQQNPDGTPYAPRKNRIQKNNQVKAKKAMFLKLRQARHLKIKTDAEGVAVGYQGKAAKIANIHQGGFLA